MLRGLNIKKVTFIFTITIILGVILLVKIKMIKRIGSSWIYCDTMQHIWSKYPDYKNIHNVKSKEYLLFEYGSTNYKNYIYYLFDMEKFIFESNFPKKQIPLNNKLLQDIKHLVSQISPKNRIYDGTESLTIDGNVYIVTYVNENSIIKFGTYTTEFEKENYNSSEIMIYSKENKKIINEIMLLLEENLY